MAQWVRNTKLCSRGCVECSCVIRHRAPVWLLRPCSWLILAVVESQWLFVAGLWCVCWLCLQRAPRSLQSRLPRWTRTGWCRGRPSLPYHRNRTSSTPGRTPTGESKTKTLLCRAEHTLCPRHVKRSGAAGCRWRAQSLFCIYGHGGVWLSLVFMLRSRSS